MNRVQVGTIVVSDESGFACSKTKLVESGVKHLRPFNISEDGQLDFSEVYQVPESEAPSGKARLEAGDILFNNTNSAELVGKAALVPSSMDAGFSNHMTRIRLNKSLIEPAYFAFWLRRLRGQGFFTSQATQWVSQAAYKSSELRKLEITLPPLAEQRRIVDLLARAEGIVRLRREAEKKAAELIPALFLDMFGDPATNPKGWLIRKVSDFVSRFEGGKNLQAGSENGSPYRILKVSAATSGTYRESESKPTPGGYEPPTPHIIRVGDMLFSRANTEELVGATAIVESTNGTTLLPDKLWRFVWAEKVEPAYMLALFQSPQVRRELGKLSSGTSASMRNISQEKLFKLSLPVAPYPLQAKFGQQASAVRSILSSQSAATAKAQETFDALLGQMFSPAGAT
jgi:type I restriction enzyme, S subunit